MKREPYRYSLESPCPECIEAEKRETEKAKVAFREIKLLAANDNRGKE